MRPKIKYCSYSRSFFGWGLINSKLLLFEYLFILFAQLNCDESILNLFCNSDIHTRQSKYNCYYRIQAVFRSKYISLNTSTYAIYKKCLIFILFQSFRWISKIIFCEMIKLTPLFMHLKTSIKYSIFNKALFLILLDCKRWDQTKVLHYELSVKNINNLKKKLLSPHPHLKEI